MKLLEEINIMENKKIVIALNLVAFPLFLIFAYLFGQLGYWLSPQSVTLLSLTLTDFLLFFPSFLLAIFAHEFIHGLFFKLFQPANKVKFGLKWESLMAYATSPGSLYSRGQMLIIGLAPFVILSLVFTLFLLLGWMNLGFYVFLAAVHAAGCVGDFYYSYLLTIKHGRRKIMAEDTETGLLIYQV